MAPNENPYMISYYVHNTNGFSISHGFRDIYRNCIFYLWPWRSKVMAPNENPYMSSHMSTIKIKSLSLVFFKRFGKIAFDLLTLDQVQRSWYQMKAYIHMISYMSTIHMESLAPVICEIFEKKSDILTFQGHLRSNFMHGSPSKINHFFHWP